jgi:hypothetical protein
MFTDYFDDSKERGGGPDGQESQRETEDEGGSGSRPLLKWRSNERIAGSYVSPKRQEPTPKGGGALSQSKSLSPLCEDINIAGILSWCQVATRGAATLPQQEKNKSEDSQRSRKTFDHVQR